jgi:hypothetical protein
MAKSKTQLIDRKAHFFMNVTDGVVHTIYEDGDDKVILAAAFASAMLENKHLYNIISAAFLTLLDDEKEKNSSNRSKKPVKSAKKSVNKK